MRNSRQSGSVFDLDASTARIADLELAMQSQDFWADHVKAGQVSKELASLKEEVEFWEGFEKKLDSGEDVSALKKEFDKQYIKIFLSGKYDRSNAIITIHGGAGGEDARDWAMMLFEMYRKYAAGAGFDFLALDELSAEISGKYAYGYLKAESGVHRLVRISPYDAAKRRHTSFALVEFLPEIEEGAGVEIKPEDLRVDTFRSSGPGGQNVNKLETAVRITHIPTNTVVAVQSERSQAQNKEKAMQVLRSRLAMIMEQQQAKELSDLRNTKDQAIEWGSQIRSYVLHPYKQVKDHRTGVESPNPDRILGGELNEFIQAEITQ